MALGAAHEHVGHQLHVDAFEPLALARLAAAFLGVEAEVPGAERPRLGLGRVGEQRADGVERLHVGDGVRARRAADRALVDQQHVVDLPGAEQVVVLGGLFRFDVQPRGDGRVERLLDERALAGAAYARDQAQDAQRKLDGDVLQVVAARPDEPQPAVARLAPQSPLAQRSAAGDPFARAALGMVEHFRGRSLEHDLAAELAGAGTHLDDLIGRRNQRRLVLDDGHRVAAIAQPAHRVDQPRQVGRVQPRRRLVEHVQHAGEVRSERRGERDALRLAAAERAQRAVDGQVPDAHAGQVFQSHRDLIDEQAAHLPLPGRKFERRSQASASSIGRAAAQPQALVEHLPHVGQPLHLLEGRRSGGAENGVDLGTGPVRERRVLDQVVDREREQARGGLVPRDQERDALGADVVRQLLAGLLVDAREHPPEQVAAVDGVAGRTLERGAALGNGADQLVHEGVVLLRLPLRADAEPGLDRQLPDPGLGLGEGAHHCFDERVRRLAVEGVEPVTESAERDRVERQPGHVGRHVDRLHPG